MSRHNRILDRAGAVLRWAAYACAVGLFLWLASYFFLPRKGFTYLLMLGEIEASRYLPELQGMNTFVLPDSHGYDAQFYVQIAMRPDLGDPELAAAVDSLPYRARRILFSWTAWLLGLGRPEWAAHVYSVQNLVAWLGLAVLLLRWFPPTGWGNFLRWIGVMYSFGLCFSVRGSLVDGPSLLMIAGGIALLEKGRPWAAAGLLGLSGLGKETNILAGAGLGEFGRDRATWLRNLGRGAVVLLPLALWMVALWLWLGAAGDAGQRNFAAPFSGYLGKWREVLGQLTESRDQSFAVKSLAIHGALTVQWLFFVLRPEWHRPWWRVGCVYATLMVFLGSAVWEGYPGAASRVLLPMALAFNVLVPRSWRWWPVLLLGNLSVFVAPDTLKPPGRESYRIEGAQRLVLDSVSGEFVTAEFDGRWYPPERSHLEYWRWSQGGSVMTLVNPHDRPLRGALEFGLRSVQPREVWIVSGGREVWRGRIESGRVGVAIRGLVFAPGRTDFRFETDVPGAPPNELDPRPLTFSLRDLVIDLEDFADR